MKVGIILHNDIHADARVNNQWSILKKYGVNVKILCTGKKKPTDATEQIERVETEGYIYKFYYISASSNSFFRNFWKKRILAYFSEKPVDILHVHDLFMARPGMDAAIVLGIPIVIDFHENYPETFQKYSWTTKFPHSLFVNYTHWHDEERYCIRNADGLVALDETFVSQLKKKHLKSGSSLEYAIYPNVPDIHQFDDPENRVSKSADDCFKIFYFGIVGYPRYLHIAKRAIDNVNQKGRNARLVIAGNVVRGDKTYVEKNVLGKNTEHIPWIELSELGKWVSEMDACISPIEKNPQHESGVANKVFQYMFFSKPLLVSNCEPQKNLVESVHCGLSYAHESPEELAEKIIWLMDNPDKAKKMGENGREAILKTYNTNVYGEKIIKLYESVLSKRSAKS